MKKNYIVIAVVVLCLIIVLYFLTPQAPRKVPEPVKISQPEYELIDRPLVEWEDPEQDLTGEGRAPKNPYEVIGYSYEHREIHAYRFGEGDKKIILVGALHGGYEWNSASLAYMFIDSLSSDPLAVPADIQVIVIPVANPDGLYKVVGSTARFAMSDAPQFEYPQDVSPGNLVVAGRFNAQGVDLNRNFDCEWRPDAVWRENVVDPGSGPFSAPESIVLRDFFLQEDPVAAVFFHSSANGIYAARCNGVEAPGMQDLMRVYGQASGYPQYADFDHYAISGDATDWLAKIGIPALTVELSTHKVIEWEKNRPAVLSVLRHYSDVE